MKKIISGLVILGLCLSSPAYAAKKKESNRKAPIVLLSTGFVVGLAIVLAAGNNKPASP